MVVQHLSLFFAVASAFHISPQPFFLDVNSTRLSNGSLKQLEPKEKLSRDPSGPVIEKEGVTWWDLLAIIIITVFIVLYAMVSRYMDMSMSDIDIDAKNSPRGEVLYPLLPDLKIT